MCHIGDFQSEVDEHGSFQERKHSKIELEGIPTSHFWGNLIIKKNNESNWL